jgi:hypothetical protein
MSQLQTQIRKISKWLYTNDSVVKQWRLKRIQQFLDVVKPPKNARIIDPGGSAYMWNLIDGDYDVTIVNLPGSLSESEKINDYNLVEADATDLSEVFEDKSFDIVFSNSVIEHVGDEEKQFAFAAEVRRLADAYWIQTPSILSPVEVHTGVPFYWRLPKAIRDRLLRSWKENLPAWSAMVEELRVLSRNRMKQLFPDANVYVERKLLFEKSYSFYKPFC